MESITIVLLLFVLIILLTIIYIFTLVRQAIRKEWLWFVITLLFSPIAVVIYWITRMFRRG